MVTEARPDDRAALPFPDTPGRRAATPSSPLAHGLRRPGSAPGSTPTTGDPLAPLVRRIAAGDPDALASLYDLTRVPIYSLVRRIVRDPGDAEEVCLDVYAQVWRSAGRYEPGRGPVMAWLLMMARSRALDGWRRSAVRGPATETFPDGMTTGREPRSPLESLLAADVGRRLRHALGTLTSAERDLIVQAFFEGWTHRELAERWRMPIGTVKTRIRTGLRKLRAGLAAPERGTEETEEEA